MQKQTVHKLLFGLIAGAFLTLPVLLLLAPQQAAGTPESMQVLPAFNKYQCVNCHTTATPIQGAAGLNAFGADFNANGSVWNRTLAEKNSDGDRCINGFELGDRDGDGIFDGQGQIQENSNPGDPSDCTVAIDVETWGALKEIFSQEIRQYIDQDDQEALYEFSLYFP